MKLVTEPIGTGLKIRIDCVHLLRDGEIKWKRTA